MSVSWLEVAKTQRNMWAVVYLPVNVVVGRTAGNNRSHELEVKETRRYLELHTHDLIRVLLLSSVLSLLDKVHRPLSRWNRWTPTLQITTT